MLPMQGEVVQVCFVVPDLDAAMKHWIEMCKVGPFLVLRNIATNVEMEARYRGEPAVIDAHIALAQMGAVQLELIQQLDDVPSPITESVGFGKLGFHHVAMWTEDFDGTKAQMAAQGIQMIHEGSFGGTRFGYFDTVPAIGCMLEIFDRTEQHVALFDHVAALSRDWDGSDPIRPMMG